MPLFKIHTDKTVYTFDPQNSILLNEAGEPVVSRKELQKRNCDGTLAMLRIQLGLKCNYHCEYCKQADQVIEKKCKNNLPALVSKIYKTYPEIRTVFFAGGEPLLYWDEIKFLVEELKKLYPAVQFAMTSNGSLLTKEHIQFFEKHNIFYSFSHDGPGQYLRSGDPLSNPDILKNIQDRLKSQGQVQQPMITANGVLTPVNNKPTKIIEYIRSKVGSEIHVSFEGVADLNTATVGKEDLLFDHITGKELSDDILRGYVEGELRNTVFEARIWDFINRLSYQTSSYRMSQKCGQLRDDVIAVDLQGNALICHSSTSENNTLGKIGELQKTKPDQFIWAQRETCSGCIVQQLCGGGCLLNTYGSDEQKTTCKNDFYYHMGIFAAAIFEITRDFITKIEVVEF